MLRTKLLNSYPSKSTGRKTFVFQVLGTDAEKAEYLAAQKKRSPNFDFEDENGEPLYWSTSPSSASPTLKITINGNVVEDTSELDLNASIKANHDFAYNQVMSGLKQRSAAGAAQRLPVDDKKPIDQE